MSGPGLVLCVLAHQDDECFLSTCIEREVSLGLRVVCVVLTDGAVRGVTAAVRDAESRRILEGLGVAPGDVHFAGSRHGIADRSLVRHLEAGLGHAEQALGALSPTRVYTLAYEGGHPDHDAAHLIAAAVALRHGCLADSWATPAYHGRGLPGPLFRVYSPLPEAGRARVRRLGFAGALRHTLLVTRYPSQRRTWLGLGPGLLWNRVLRRREVLLPLLPTRLRERPHPGPLLYERLFGVSYDGFRQAAQPFVSRHFGAGSRASPYSLRSSTSTTR